jgi:2'-5' RNA ligase
VEVQNQLYDTGAITLQTYRQETGATETDTGEGWENIPPMVKVEGIGAPVPLSELPTLWKQLLPVVGEQAEMMRAMADIAETTVEAQQQSEPQPADGAEKKQSSKSAFVSLDLSGNEILKELQQAVLEQLPDHIEPLAPEDLHMTLVHAPELEPGEQLDKTVTKLAVMGKDNAIVVIVEPDPAIQLLQYDTVTQFMGQEIPVSDYHQPKAFTPHITLGYAGEKGCDKLPPINKMELTGHDLVVAVKEGEVFERVALVNKVSPRKALVELKQWGKFQKRASNGKRLNDRPFKFNNVRPSIERFIDEQMKIGIPYDTVLTEAINMQNVKAIETTKTNYMRAVAAIISEARAGNIPKARARDNLRNETKLTIARVYSDGLEDAGVFEDATEETREAIRKFQLEPTPFVHDLMERIYSDEGITDAEATQKPQAWWAGSLSKVYSAGLRAGNENGMYAWDGDDGVDSCVTCQWLDGPPVHIHRFKVWDANGLDLTGGSFVGQRTACKGGYGNCFHFLRRTASRAQGGSLKNAPR